MISRSSNNDCAPFLSLTDRQCSAILKICRQQGISVPPSLVYGKMSRAEAWQRNHERQGRRLYK